MVSLLKLFLFLVPACVLLAPAVLGLTTVAQTEDDKCFSCCAYQNCPDGWQCCGCPLFLRRQAPLRKLAAAD